MTYRSAIGIDIGGTRIRAARISPAGEILATVATRTQSQSPELVPGQIVELVRSLDAPGIAGIGIGVPGRVDANTGEVLSGGFVDLSGLDLLGEMATIPIVVDNDANMAMRAEAAVGAAAGARTAVLFTIGTGIGGSIIVDGAMLKGHRTAGQLGHIAIDGKGRACVCGRHGCVETTSSGTALARHIDEIGLPPDTTVETLLDEAARGDGRASRVLEAWAKPMRLAIDTMAAIVDPELVVLGGGLGHAMHQALAAFPATAPWYQCTVVGAALGDRAGVIGAGLAALERSPLR